MATVSSALKKYTTLEELEKTQTGPVWVLNSTERRGDAGNLIMSVPKLNGNGTDPVRVKLTFIPFDLTQQVPKAQLLASSEFRSTIRKGDLKLCSSEYANALLNTETGREEKRRIDNLLSQAQMMSDNIGVTEQDTGEDEDEYFDPNNMEGEKSSRQKRVEEIVVEKEKVVTAPKVDVKVVNLAARAKEEGWTQLATVAAIRRYGKMKAVEVKYLMLEFRGKTKIQAHLEELKKQIITAKAKAKSKA